MKEPIQRVEIEPENCYLEYVGPCKLDEPGQVLRGRVRLTVAKTTKIRSMVVKFKGFCHVCLTKSTDAAGTVAATDAVEAEISFLPKIKVPLLDSKSTTMSPGEHIVPWQLEVPNIFPRSLMVKRASIYYKVQVSISTGLRKKAITAEHPIVLLRHLLPRKEFAPLIATKTYRYTVTGKFHYEVECPRVVCLEQNMIPIAVKYICIADKKDVKSISTQILQNELYRCENLSKSESNLEQFGKDSKSTIFGQRFVHHFNANPRCRRITRRKGSMCVHDVGKNPESSWKLPTIIYHTLDEHLTFGLESPSVTIYHQLEVTFKFGSKYDNLRAKIPIIFTSLPNHHQSEEEQDGADNDIPMPKYKMETILHHVPDNVTIDPEKSKGVAGAEARKQQQLRDKDDNDPISKQQEIFTGVVDAFSRTGSRLSRAPYSLATGFSNLTLLDENQQQYAPSPSLSAFGDLPRSLRRTASAVNLTIPETTPEPRQNIAAAPRRPPRSPARQLTAAAAAPPLRINTSFPSKETAVRAPVSDDTLPMRASRRGSIASSEALPMIDRDAMNACLRDSKLYSVYSGSSLLGPSHRVVPWLQMLCEEYDNDTDDEGAERAAAGYYHYDDEDADGDDEMSLYSEAFISSRDAPSFNSSSKHGSSSHASLRSRPPSIVPSPVAGLPTATALQPQLVTGTHQIEESFAPTTMSIISYPTTEASSHILTPRTGLALHRQRMAMERIPPPPPLPPSSTLPPELPTKRANLRSRSPSMPLTLTTHDYPQEVQKHYLEAELPPVPPDDDNDGASNPQNNKTVCYFEDSDEEENLWGPQATSTVTLPDHPLLSSSAHDEAPPQLPRLSLGSTFSASLHIDHHHHHHDTKH